MQPAHLQKAVTDLVAKLRTKKPETLAPEVYGLTNALQGEPAIVVHSLCGITGTETWERSVDGAMIDCRPTDEETFAAWCKRTGYHTSMELDTTQAYNTIGFDWVDWKFRPLETPKVLALGVEGSNQKILINMTNEPWFSDGIMGCDELCPHSEGGDAANAWSMGRHFALTLGFDGATRAAHRLIQNRPLTEIETKYFKNGTIDFDVLNAAKALKDEIPDAAELLLTLEALENIRTSARKPEKTIPENIPAL